MRRIKVFFQESIAELKKVVWPGRSEVSSSTKVVIISITIFAVVLGLVDFVFLSGLNYFFQ